MSGEPIDFKTSVSAYALAIQIAAALSGFWGLTDDWDFHYSVAIPSIGSASSAASNMLTDVAPGSQYASISAAAYGISSPQMEADLQVLDRMAGVIPLGQQNPSQVRYQGLWWGSERIWADDFVRLKLPRGGIAPAGYQDILAPSGPGPSRAAMAGHTEGTGGAASRGLFIHINALFVVDVPTGDGRTVKECRASGPLYELADADWIEPLAATVPSGSNLSTSLLPDPAKQPDGPSQLSQPPHASHYALPDAPMGYKFRPILSEGLEAVISLTLISGRYYPRILSHPLLKEAVAQALNPGEHGGLLDSNQLWSLEGLSAGHSNCVDPTRYVSSRDKMKQEAEESARQIMQDYVSTWIHEEEMKKEKQEMDVDELPMDLS
jgi:hypothetical protein